MLSTLWFNHAESLFASPNPFRWEILGIYVVLWSYLLDCASSISLENQFIMSLFLCLFLPQNLIFWMGYSYFRTRWPESPGLSGLLQFQECKFRILRLATRCPMPVVTCLCHKNARDAVNDAETCVRGGALCVVAFAHVHSSVRSHTSRMYRERERERSQYMPLVRRAHTARARVRL